MISTDMATNLINASNPPRAQYASQELSKDTFLKLLTEQLRHQDPLSPMDNENFVQQVATFSNLEQQIDMNDKLGQLLTFQSVAQAASLIGKQVTGLLDGVVVQGTVEQVIYVSGKPVLALDTGDELPHNQIISISNAPTPEEPPVEEPTPDPDPVDTKENTK